MDRQEALKVAVRRLVEYFQPEKSTCSGPRRAATMVRKATWTCW